MAVAFGGSLSVTPATGSSVTSGNWTISGSNLLILVHCGVASGTVSSVSWSLGSGTPVQLPSGGTTDGTAHGEVWAIPAPTSGTGTFTVNFSASVAFQVNADYFTGADQTTPCPSADVQASITETSSITLTPTNLTANDASGGLTANTVGGDVTSVTPHQTFLNDNTAVNLETGYATGTGGITFNMNAGGKQAHIAVRIVAASGGGGGTATPSPMRTLRGAGL